MAGDYYPLVGRAVSHLGLNANYANRRKLYERLKHAQISELKTLGFSKAEISDECRALSDAIDRIEKTKNLFQLPGDTALFILSLLLLNAAGAFWWYKYGLWRRARREGSFILF
jgi:hypothetical protein